MLRTLRFAGGIVTDIGYGHRIESFDDDFFSMGERFLEHALAATAPNLMDLHPVCEYAAENIQTMPFY